jgi:hypothetical protein
LQSFSKKSVLCFKEFSSKRKKMREFSIQLKCLKFIGFENVVEKKRKILLRCFQRLNILIMFYCVSAEISFAVLNFGDIFAATESLSFILTALITCFKILTFYCYMERFGDLIWSVKKLSDEGGCFS